MTPAKAKRGRITNARTANFIEFLYNPTKISDKKGNNLAEDAIPGSSDPIIHFASGKARIITMMLPLCGESSIRLRGVNLLNGVRNEPIDVALSYSIAGELDFFRSLEHPVDPALPKSDAGPDNVLFTFGSRYNGVECVVDSIDIEETEWDPDLNPTRATVNLVLREFTKEHRFASSVWRPYQEGIPV